VTVRPNPNEQRFISASELAEYAYCRRAWWLRAVRGTAAAEPTDRLARGRSAHWRHGALILVARSLAIAALLAVGAALWMAFARAR